MDTISFFTSRAAAESNDGVGQKEVTYGFLALLELFAFLALVTSFWSFTLSTLSIFKQFKNFLILFQVTFAFLPLF